MDLVLDLTLDLALDLVLRPPGLAPRLVLRPASKNL